IAHAICEARHVARIETSTQLAQIIKTAMPRYEKHKHPATRTFQAIRIYINQELEDLSQGLQAAFEVMGSGGRLVVISFHSLEDRIVKQWMRKLAKGVTVPSYIPIRAQEVNTPLKIMRKCVPSALECAENNRARSALMRVAEKI
ncbi:MAG TPA: 16S rRNA (cytosine(1402)-N(4))-methyltransferase RsmH, partial [Gammaproteobacteria bacterium]|nr:16S rRNA (cytosine(1402)-N(4))-methyltransferase RsmH [Gammaproteobacteria bacterium]